MALTLDDLLQDNRLARLFAKDNRHCALQLWILQIKSEKSIENRLVYGRLLPYSHANDQWSSSNDASFYTFGQFEAQIFKLNLYVESSRCEDLLRLLTLGLSISALSEELQLRLSDQLKVRFGTTSLAADFLVYRPVAHLINRNAYERHSIASPHAMAGAFSASITQTAKGALFILGQDYATALAELTVKHLDADTGLDFGGTDTARLGDLELLVFPALDDLERGLLSTSWTDNPNALVVRFNPMQVPHFNHFQFRLNIANDSQLVHSSIAIAERNAENVFEYEFELSDQLRERTDSTELEIFGFRNNQSREGTLCCRWRVGYFREINLRGHVVGHVSSPVKFDWLEKATRPSVAARVQAALTINRNRLGFSDRIGGREADPWVPINRDFVLLFTRLHPPKSEGRFFLRWSQGDGEGRLQFVEWFRTLLTKHRGHQIVIFDPYFEAAGLALVLLAAAQGADCIIFRSLPKRASGESQAMPDESGRPIRSGIDDLLTNCEHNSHLLRQIKLRIYGLKEGRLHDRYILVMGADKLPISGFNLSNSFQAAAQDQPLVITPIPMDVLLKVEQYKSALVQEAHATLFESETESPSARLLFDSTSLPVTPRHYEPLRFLDDAEAGNVIGVWTGELSMQGLSGSPLKELMTALNLFKDDSLTLPTNAGLLNCLAHQAADFANFTSIWKVLGEVLARSHTEDLHFRQIESEHNFLAFLKGFLDTSFNRTHDGMEKVLAITNIKLFRESIEALLHSPYYPHQLCHAIKHTVLTWPEYFAVKLLWQHTPHVLLAITEAQLRDLSMEPAEQNIVRLSLLGQIISEISQSVQFGISEKQRDLLISSGNGLLKWMGLNAIEMLLKKPGGLSDVLQLIAVRSYPEQVQALGWMINRAARDTEKTEIYNGLVAALHKALPATICVEDLSCLIDSMRGHMRRLTWIEPWLFQDVIFRLLQSDRANIDDACEIWIRELIILLEPEPKDQPRLFDRMREGQTTNIAAFLFAYSSPEQRQACVKSMQPILKRQQRIVQQPLASTSGWSQWDGALVISMWILAFTRWSEYYLHQRGMTDHDLEDLSEQARALAIVRPKSEWQSRSASSQSELVEFFEQGERLLTSHDDKRKQSPQRKPKNN